MTRNTGRSAARHSGVSPAHSPFLTFWLPGGLLLAQLVGVTALLGWLISNAGDTTSRRALRVPYAVASFDLAKPMTDREFEAYRLALESPGERSADGQPTETAFHDVRFDSPPVPPALKGSLRSPPVDSALMEVTPFGPLPVISGDGRAVWQAYSQPVDRKAVRAAGGVIAIIVENAGLSEPTLRSFLERLPAPVTFAFNPYAPELDHWIGRTRALGHEVLMGLPMEPKTFPHSDPGPRALMKDYNEARNLEAMKWSLGRGSGYVGVMTIMGDSFTEAVWRIDPVLREAERRGLLFIDNTTDAGRSVTRKRAAELGLPYVASGFRVGEDPAQTVIEETLRKTEAAATRTGHAVLVVPPYPVVLALLEQWLPMLKQKKLMLVPVSYMATIEKERRKKE